MKIFKKRNTEAAAFDRYIHPDVMKEILQHPFDDMPALQRKRVGYVLIQLQDDDSARLNELYPIVINCARHAGAVVESLNISLPLITFGGVGTTPVDVEALSHKAASHIIHETKNAAKAVYGTCEAEVGSYGYDGYYNFGSILPGYSRLVENLCQIKYGEIKEVTL
jgi:hypothetical protein